MSEIESTNSIKIGRIQLTSFEVQLDYKAQILIQTHLELNRAF